MAEGYEITPAVEIDLLEIAHYTLDKWGAKQLLRYETQLEAHFKALGKGEVQARQPMRGWPELRLSKCEHHYAFSLLRPKLVPLILAVFHENRDLMARLEERLQTEGLE